MDQTGLRTSAFKRLGLLQGKLETNQEKLNSYFERSGRFNTWRRTDAYLSLCHASSAVGDLAQIRRFFVVYDECKHNWATNNDQYLAISACIYTAAAKAQLSIDITDRCLLIINHLLENDLHDTSFGVCGKDANNLYKELPNFLELVALLEVMSENTILEETQVGQITMSLNLIVSQMCAPKSVSSTASTLDIPIQPVDQTWIDRMKLSSIRFVAAASEQLYIGNTVTRGDLWTELQETAGASVGGEMSVGQVSMWQMIKEHSHLQYQSTNMSDLTSGAEIIMALALKLACLTSIAYGELDKVLLSWIATMLVDAQQLDNINLASSVIQVTTSLAVKFPSCTNDMIRYLKHMVIYGPRRPDRIQSLASLAARDLQALLKYDKDAMISTMYTFANFLNGRNNTIETFHTTITTQETWHTCDQLTLSSTVSHSSSVDDKVSANVIEAISVFGNRSEDGQVPSK